MKTGNTCIMICQRCPVREASMEPGHEDREYLRDLRLPLNPVHASMEPGHEDREYLVLDCDDPGDMPASMEPGHEDREYDPIVAQVRGWGVAPQWSPAMKTGNTSSRLCRRRPMIDASMEPGHEDREYMPAAGRPRPTSCRLNGARP